MVFSSPVFLFYFLPAVLASMALAPRSVRNALLLLASLLFYAWGEPRAVLVLLVSIAVNYALGLALSAAAPRRAKWIVAVAVVFNVGLLAIYKYAGFAVRNLDRALAWLHLPRLEVPEIALPIGVSFFTFQALSYVIDVQRGLVPPQRNLLDFALYKSLFPQLIAGPIVRYVDVAAELTARTVDRAGFADGVRRFVLGLGKKMLIANVVAVPARDIFAIPAGELPVSVAWLGVVCFAVQIYFDFSGYSDMAIGLGRMLGFRFLENFDFPYVARSVTEFWRRWHISLSSWFRDYVYIPLGGNRRGNARTYLNLIAVFFLCGLWHGAAWNFVAWGLFHGGFLVIERGGLGRALERAPALVGRAYLLLVVLVGWVLFNSPSLAHATSYCGALFGIGAAQPGLHNVGLYFDTAIALALVAGVIGSTPWLARVRAWRARLDQTSGPSTLRWAVDLGAVALVLGVLLLSALQLSADTYNPFIYFRF